MLLAYLIFSDKTHNFGVHTAPLHPLVVYLPKAGMQTMRAVDSHSYLALLPQVSPKQLGMPVDRKQRTTAQNERCVSVWLVIQSCQNQDVLQNC